MGDSENTGWNPIFWNLVRPPPFFIRIERLANNRIMGKKPE